MSTTQTHRSTVATSATESAQTRAELYFYFFRQTLAEEHRRLENNRFSDQIEDVTVHTHSDQEPYFHVQVSDRLAKSDLKRFISRKSISHYVNVTIA